MPQDPSQGIQGDNNLQGQSMANDSMIEDQFAQQKDSIQDGLGDADPNYDNESAIDLNGLTESEIQAI